MQLYKYEALGNDYLILDAQFSPTLPSKDTIQRVCHRHYGIGSDGLLYGPLKSDKGRFSLKIYNPDGSEAEKSGNGLRIFAKYLWDKALVKDEHFAIETMGGIVDCQVDKTGESISVCLGQASFLNPHFPEPEMLTVADQFIPCYCLNIGNPHAICIVASLDKNQVLQLGPKIEHHPRFPQKTNVQFLKVIDDTTLALEIWERGAGYTLASGSSAAACAALAVRLKLCKPSLTILMPGGSLLAQVDPDYRVTIIGPAKAIAKIDLIF